MNDVSKEMDSNQPFFIRDYINELRKQDIHRNWPFSKKCLQVIKKHGVTGVLPPFEACDSVRSLWCRECVGSSGSKNENGHVCCIEEKKLKLESDSRNKETISQVSKQICALSVSGDKLEHGEASDLSSDDVPHPMNVRAHISTKKTNFNHPIDIKASPSTNKFGYRPKKRGKKNKKRSMEDIYADARSCSLVNHEEINKSTRGVGSSIILYNKKKQTGDDDTNNAHIRGKPINNEDPVHQPEARKRKFITSSSRS